MPFLIQLQVIYRKKTKYLKNVYILFGGFGAIFFVHSTNTTYIAMTNLKT